VTSKAFDSVICLNLNDALYIIILYKIFGILSLDSSIFSFPGFRPISASFSFSLSFIAENSLVLFRVFGQADTSVGLVFTLAIHVPILLNNDIDPD
jgi:hypothetical protein